jgi:hypothetical protein
VHSDWLIDTSKSSSVTKTSSTLKSAYNEMLEIMESDLKQNLVKNDELFQNQENVQMELFTEVQQNLETLLASLNSTTKSKLNDKQEKLTETSSNTEQAFSEEHQKLATQYGTQIEESFGNLEKQVKVYYDNVSNIQIELLEELGTSINDFQKNISDMTLNQMKALLTSLKEKSEIILNVQQNLSPMVQSFIDIEQNVKDQLLKGVTDQFDIMMQGAKGYAEEILKSVKAGESALNARVSSLTDFDKIIKNYKYPKITSAPIIGWNAAMQIIEGMFENVKSGITLLIPNPAQIPIEKVKATKKTRRVTIASQFNLDNDSEKKTLKELLEKGNVNLRRLERGSFGGLQESFPPFLAADRDSEEVLFGSRDLESSESAFIGMVSQNSSFIDLMGKVVLSDFLSKAKRINERDL